MNPGYSLSEKELDELDAFLLSDEAPEECMDISTLDGFLASIVLNPDMLMPSRWLHWVWDMENGKEAAAFSNLGEASRITGYIMRHYNAVLHSINEGWFDPLLFELAQPDGSEFFDAEGWCAGFMRGVALFPNNWETVLDKHPEMLAPMILLGTEMGWEMLEESGDDKRAIQEAYEAIPAAVAALHDHFKPLKDQASNALIASVSRSSSKGTALPFKRDEPKAGRNDLCPCGSGKKYKKCCGAVTLH